jgi:transcriptional regulator with XRE-family HTH domain
LNRYRECDTAKPILGEVQEFSKVIGRKIKELREAAGLTQQQLATNAGLSSSNLSQIEQGHKRDPRISTLKALARALGVSIDALAENEDPGAEEKPKTKKGGK